MEGFSGVSLCQSSVPGNWEMTICVIYITLPHFPKSTHDSVMWHLCVVFSSTLRQSLGGNQIFLSLSLLWLNLIRNYSESQGSETAGQHNRIFLFFVHYWMRPLSGLGKHPRRVFHSARWPELHLEPWVKNWDCVVRTSWLGIIAVMPAEQKR